MSSIWHVLFAVVAGVILLYLLLVVSLLLVRPKESSLGEALRLLPDVVRLIHRPKTPTCPAVSEYACGCSWATSRCRSTLSPTSYPCLATPTTRSS